MGYPFDVYVRARASQKRRESSGMAYCIDNSRYIDTVITSLHL